MLFVYSFDYLFDYLYMVYTHIFELLVIIFRKCKNNRIRAISRAELNNLYDLLLNVRDKKGNLVQYFQAVIFDPLRFQPHIISCVKFGDVFPKTPCSLYCHCATFLLKCGTLCFEHVITDPEIKMSKSGNVST